MNIAIAMMVVAAWFGGCAQQRPTADSAPNLGNSIARVGVYVDQASASVALAKPHADTTGQVHLTNATASLAGATSELSVAQSELAKTRKEVSDLDSQNKQQADKLAAYKHRWLGDATIFWFKWLVAAWVGLGIAGVALSVFGGGMLGGVGMQLLHLLPLSNLFVFAAGALQKPKA